ncbi:MAG: biotin/lipoyl-containing protein, partial [Candidatus Korobacteraceae bacterium]
MPTDVIMPQMGESIFEGTITKWLKQPGEKVQRDEPLFEISTDKVDAEIPAPASGTLQDIKVQAGATVQVNTVVGTIAAEGEATASKSSALAPAASQSTPAGGDGSRSAQTDAAQPPSGEAPQKSATPPAGKESAPAQEQKGSVEPIRQGAEDSEGGEQDRLRSSPLVRRIAKENKVDLAQVPGTGLGGRITKDDIESFIAKHGAGGAQPSTPARPAAVSAPSAPEPST